MKAKVRAPYFETGVKCYIYGEKVIKYAKACDEVAGKYDIDVIFIAPYTEIHTIREQTEHLIVLAPYMDCIRPGRGMGMVLPEALKAAGAQGVLMNHCEKPMTLNAIKKTIERANELDMLSFVCADSVVEAEAIALMHPDIINPEPSEYIGSGTAVDMEFVLECLKGIKAIDSKILVEPAAGISCGQDVYDFIYAGVDAVGSASGILNSPDPYAMLDEMVSNVRKAYDDRMKNRSHKLPERSMQL